MVTKYLQGTWGLFPSPKGVGEAPAILVGHLIAVGHGTDLYNVSKMTQMSEDTRKEG